MPLDPRIPAGLLNRESVPLLTPGDAQAQQQKQQAMAQNQQIRAAELDKQRAEAEQAQSSQRASALLQGVIKNGIRGGKIDIDLITNGLAEAGLGDKIPAFQKDYYAGQKAIQDWRDAKLKADAAERAAMLSLARQAEAAGDEAPGILLHGMGQHVDAQMTDEKDVLPYITQLEQDPTSAARIIAQMKAAAGDVPKTAADKLVGVDTVDESGQHVTKYTTPKEGDVFPKYEKPGAAGGDQGFTLTPGGKRFDASGKMIAEVPESPDRGSRATAPVAVMGPDGKPIFVRPDQAYGRQPANSREQGRAVTSGDANRLADYDSSLNDLKTLKLTISGSQVTGTAAKIGASIPNWVTDITGVGAESKSKQAVIDRVKQVIGKALEGGVLRKEDESKYEKILPTIGDTQSVVATKLAGLEAAISQRRQTQLDNLEDAGYDVSRYRTRTTAPVQPKFRYNPATGKTEPIGGQ